MSPQRPARAAGPAFGKAQESWSQRLRSHWLLVSIAAVWVSANAVVLFWPIDDRDREIYDGYIAIWREIESFRSGETQAALWDAFAEEKLAELESVVGELEADASPDEPNKQHLLWAARDYLVPLLEGKAGVSDDKLREHMDRVRGRLQRDGFDVEPLISEDGDIQQPESSVTDR